MRIETFQKINCPSCTQPLAWSSNWPDIIYLREFTCKCRRRVTPSFYLMRLGRGESVETEFRAQILCRCGQSNDLPNDEYTRPRPKLNCWSPKPGLSCTKCGVLLT
jgi:hypothetical protein